MPKIFAVMVREIGEDKYHLSVDDGVDGSYLEIGDVTSLDVLNIVRNYLGETDNIDVRLR